jgi:hypothetical protein
MPNLVAVRQWREAQFEAGQPSSLEDYDVAHGICSDCSGYGAKMIGWSDPFSSVDIQAAKELKLEQLPVYEICPTCDGKGKPKSSK